MGNTEMAGTSAAFWKYVLANLDEGVYVTDAMREKLHNLGCYVRLSGATDDYKYMWINGPGNTDFFVSKPDIELRAERLGTTISGPQYDDYKVHEINRDV